VATSDSDDESFGAFQSGNTLRLCESGDGGEEEDDEETVAAGFDEADPGTNAGDDDDGVDVGVGVLLLLLRAMPRL